jgi:hypothetical protein
MSQPQSSPRTPQEAAKTDTSTDQATPIVVRVPAQLPVLTKQVSRALLALLTELTEIEVLDRPPGGKEIT